MHDYSHKTYYIMNIPTHCPKCGDVLLCEEVFALKSDVWRKVCNKRLNHKFSVFHSVNGVVVDNVCIQIAGATFAHWDLKNNTLTIAKEGLSVKKTEESSFDIPYFHPDISNYDHLVAKLQTYIIFS